MEINKNYLDDLITQNTKKSGEIFTIYIDFKAVNIDIVNLSDSGTVPPDKIIEYRDAIEYYFTLISNASEFFSDIEKKTDKDVIEFNAITFDFVNYTVTIDVNTQDEKTKEILQDFFTKYQKEYSDEKFAEIYNINEIE